MPAETYDPPMLRSAPAGARSKHEAAPPSFETPRRAAPLDEGGSTT